MTGTILKYPGSKNKIADKIISIFPDNYRDMTYIEPFFGSGTVFFRKAPSIIETVNDLNGDIYNFFLQIRENADEFARLVENTPWSRREFEEAYVKTDSDIENARRFIVRCWFAIGSNNSCRSGWSHNIKDNNGNIAAFCKVPELIREASIRLRPKPGNCVQIENRDAFELMEKYNRENVLMYLDPPYVLKTRKNRKMYKFEFTNDDHVRLCDLANKSSAKIILSGYKNEIYETLLKNFRKTKITAYDEKGNQRVEILYHNYAAVKELFEEYDEKATNSGLRPPCAAVGK